MPPKASKSKEAPAERPILGRFSSHLKIGIVCSYFHHFFYRLIIWIIVDSQSCIDEEWNFIELFIYSEYIKKKNELPSSVFHLIVYSHVCIHGFLIQDASAYCGFAVLLLDYASAL